MILVTIRFERRTFSKSTHPIGVMKERPVLPRLATTQQEQQTPMLASNWKLALSKAKITNLREKS